MTAPIDTQRGWALMAAVGAIAVLSILWLAAAQSQNNAALLVGDERERAQREAHAVSAAARIGFLLLTEPIGDRALLIGGAEGARMAEASAQRSAAGGRSIAVSLDGARHLMDGDFVVSIQDEAGLIDVNACDAALIESALRNEDAPRPDRLANALCDFVDEDNIARGRGARSGRESIDAKNAPLVSVIEALDAQGWRQSMTPALQDRALRRLAALNASAPININTAPPAVLAAMLGDARRARDILAQRAAEPIGADSALGAQLSAAAPVQGVGFHPGGAFRVTIRQSDAQTPWLETHLTLGRIGDVRPLYATPFTSVAQTLIEPSAGVSFRSTGSDDVSPG
ncbi:MAG: hypothetical protein GC189_02380 [Alphaproteobacteria bacterium]|nr:hypothetical protein [Alphaproteobacteria bacterium]